MNCWLYKADAVLEFLNDATRTSENKSLMLRIIGNSFKRDALLPKTIASIED